MAPNEKINPLLRAALPYALIVLLMRRRITASMDSYWNDYIPRAPMKPDSYAGLTAYWMRPIWVAFCWLPLCFPL